MIEKLHLSVLVYIGLLVVCVLLVANGVAVHVGWLRWASIISSVLIILLAAFDKWGWRCKYLKGWFVKKPHLWGTWKVTLRSDWVDPKTNQQISPIVGFMVVRQCYSKITLRQLTRESSSDMLVTQIRREDDGRYVVSGIYRNTPRIDVQNRSRPHLGSFVLEVQNDPVTQMEGHCWTDRKTTGPMRLTDRKPDKYYASFDDAAVDMGTEPASSAAPRAN